MLYYHVVTLTSLLATSVKWYNVPNFGTKSVISDIWPIFNDLWRHDDVTCQIFFYIRSIPETFYHQLDTLVTGYCVPWLNVKQTRNGFDNRARIGLSPLLSRYIEVCFVLILILQIHFTIISSKGGSKKTRVKGVFECSYIVTDTYPFYTFPLFWYLPIVIARYLERRIEVLIDKHFFLFVEAFIYKWLWAQTISYRFWQSRIEFVF